MMHELVIKKCVNCGATIHVMKTCEVICCNKAMLTLKPNSVEADEKKHVPTYEIENNLLKVKVNHVMEEDHFIEWLCLKTSSREEFVYFRPNEEAVALFQMVEKGTLYAYCNKHGLWMIEIEK